MKSLFLFISFVLTSLINKAQTPVAYYPFNGNANDAAGSLNGTVNGAVLTTDRFGNANSAYSFDGVNDYIGTTGLAISQNQNWTISAWVKATSLSQASTIVLNGLSTVVAGNGYSMSVENAAGGSPGNFLKLHYPGQIIVNSGFSFNSTATWHHVVITRDISAIGKMYFDGVLSATTTTASINPPGGDFRIGSATGVGFWNGSIDEVKVYNNALTDAQVQAEYAATSQFPKPGSGNAISFDGVDDHITTSAYVVPTTGDFTVDFWVFNRSNAGFREFISQGASGDAFYIGLDASGTGAMRCGDNWLVTGAILPLNKWIHVSMTKTGTNATLYLNGMQVATQAGYTISAAGTTTTIGKQYGGITEFPDASLDEVRIWNTALTQSQIRDRMCRKITNADALYSNLVGYYNFDESTGNTAFDGTANGNNGTLTNNPTRVTSGAHIGNTSAHNYAGATSNINLAHPTRGDDLTATLTAGTADGVQVYCVTDVPNTTNGQVFIQGNNGYFGVFPINGTGNQYTATYNYDGITGIVNENGLKLYKRNDNAATTWSNAVAMLNTTANTLTVTGQNTEYMVGEDVPPNIVLTGALTGDFQTLKAAFDAINAGGGSGAITITVLGNTTETAQASLNQTNYTIEIVPNGNRIIAGNLAVSLVQLNGADNVTINGQTLFGANTLTFRNTNTGTTASSIRISDGASNNIVRKCIVEGSSTSTLVTGGALVILTGTTGNSLNNILDSNLVRPATAGGLTFGIVVGRENASTLNTIENTQVTNNLIENVFTSAAAQSTGILIRNNTVNNLIRGNSIYSNLTFTNSINDATYFGIRVFSTGSNTIGTGNVIDSNYVGGTAPTATGGKMIISSAVRMRVHGIFLQENASAANSSITKNVVRNLDISSTNNVASTSNPFMGIWVATANLQAFNHNTLGDVTNNSVTIAMNPGNTSGLASFGMFIQPGCATPIANNFIGGLTLTSTASAGNTGSLYFASLYTSGAAAVNLRENIIGAAVANNINVNSTAPAAFQFLGIENDAPAGTSVFNMDNNIVRNITASNAVVFGISQQNYLAATTNITGTINDNSITNVTMAGNSSYADAINYTTYSSTTSLVNNVTVSSNQVSYFSATSGNNIALGGIVLFNQASTVNRMKGRIENNTISNLVNPNPVSTSSASSGISFTNDIIVGDSMVVASNIIDGISNAGNVVSINNIGNSNGIIVRMNNSATNGIAVIRDNIVHGINASSTANAGTRAHGISVFGNATTIERNKIYDLRNTATSASARIEPILLRSRSDDANTSLVRNNMIAINATSEAQIAGVRLQDAATKSNLYHNSILLEGSSTANSYSLLKDATAVADVKNNILYNAVTGSGTAYAIGLQTDATGYTGNNNYFVSPATATLAQIGAANHTLSSWQAATTQDAAAQEGQTIVTTNPSNLFLDKSVANLLIKTSNATEPAKASDKGMALSAFVPNDFLGSVRSTTTPDIGANEFLFSSVLPLNLLSFSGNKINADAQLQWRTANEVNVSHFELQRSDNGQNFLPICIVQAGGSSYSFNDVNIFSQKSLVFYRLKSIDIDGKFSYSSIIKLSNRQDIKLTVFPNPTQNVVTISGIKEKGVIRIFSSDGKLLQQQTAIAQSMTIDMSKYTSGLYVLQYQREGEVINQQLIKQ